MGWDQERGGGQIPERAVNSKGGSKETRHSESRNGTSFMRKECRAGSALGLCGMQGRGQRNGLRVLGVLEVYYNILLISMHRDFLYKQNSFFKLMSL